jgi:hypothetical protein
VNNDDLVAELRSEFGQPSNGNDDLVAELRSELTGNRPIASLSGSVPPPPGFGDSVRIGLEQTPGFPEGTLSAIRRPLLTGLASAGGTAAGLASPVPGGAYLGGVAGGLAGDAFNNYLDGVPISDAVSPANVARGALYGTMRGRLLADTVKLAGGNAVIDAISGEPMSLGRTAAQTAPALIAPGLRTAGTIGRFARDAKAGGLTEAMDKFQGTYKTPAQQALVDEMPELFPTRPTIVVRGPSDFLDEAGIIPSAGTETFPEPRDGKWFQQVVKPGRTLGTHMRAPIGYFERSSDPAANELGKRIRLFNDARREFSVTGKQINADIIGRLNPAEQAELDRYLVWRDMAEKDAWTDEVRLAGTLKDSGDSSLDSLVSTFDDDTMRQWQAYDDYRAMDGEVSPTVKAAADEIRERVLNRFDQLNLVTGTKTWDPQTGEVREYKSGGAEMYPRVPREVRPTEDPHRTAVARGDISPQQASARELGGGNAPNTEVGRRTWIYEDGRFEKNPQRTLDAYVDEQAKRIAQNIAFGPPGEGTGPWGTEALRLHADLRDRGRTFDKELADRALNAIYKPDIQENAAVAVVKRLTSNVALAKSAVTQIPQASNNFAIAGFGNTLKGLLRRRAEARKFSLAAANDPALRKYYEEAGQAGKDTLTGKAVGVVEENWNRSNSAIGFGPHLRSLGKEAMEYLDAGVDIPARLAREASFYGVTPETLATQTRLFGEPSWTRPMRQAIDKAQFHAEVGDVPEGFRSGPFSIVTTYKGFPYKQAGFFKNEIVSPMLSGNMEEFDLGLERLLRRRIGTIALGVPTWLGKDLIAGRDLSSPEQLAATANEDEMGLLATPLNLAGSFVSGEPLNTHAMERSMIPAPVSVFGRLGVDGWKAIEGIRDGELDPLAKVLLRDALPMANLSGTGLEGLLGPPAYKYLVEAPR